ncbi:hypothetical protein TOPH_08065 [Tolypocladium ophioglossoides CBS 100239]|uniref:MARVEL domain-containing protein n=1 Tax=Tolypocladium ophioglossoides (strain CBS 100239) TaxID=1163406 RepID=A0A0L0MZT6_TOLOC|nr:hypothetical protein TOPH_08065 [Tolypocladium ophioglossoides CBS 100239]
MEQTHNEVASGHVLETPIWVFAIRIAQIVLSIIILGLAANIAHDLYLDELGLAIAVSVLTWIIVAYALTTEKVPDWHAGYHIVAVLALDAFLLILWLAAWAAAAAKRALFKVPTTVSGCVDNGSTFNSKNCFVKRDSIEILFKRGLDEMAAIAGLGALVWILFIATFVWTLLQFLAGRKEGRFPIDMGTASTAATTTTANNTYQMEPKVEQQPLQPEATGQYQQPPQPVQSPYEQQPPYSPPQDPQAYPQYPPQQYPPQLYQQPVQQGSELSGQQQQQQQQQQYHQQ